VWKKTPHQFFSLPQVRIKDPQVFNLFLVEWKELPQGSMFLEQGKVHPPQRIESARTEQERELKASSRIAMIRNYLPEPRKNPHQSNTPSRSEA
jgi:hypothetical protein